MPMKVLHLDTEVTWRGGENQLALLTKGLKKLGVESILVAKKGSAIEQRLEEFAAEKTIFLPLRGELDLLSAKKIASVVDREEVSLIHCHTSHAHTLGFIAKTLSKIKPKVIVTRRVDFDVYSKGAFKPLTALKYRLMADHYIAISKKVRDVLIAAGVPKGKVSLVYSGVAPERVRGGDGQRLRSLFKIGEGETVLGNISYFADHKAHEDMIEAVRIVRNRGHRVRLFLAGHGEREAFLRKMVKDLNLGKVVTFLGYREDVKDLLAFFDLFLVSSREEGLSTSIIDAFFAKCPVVATDAGGIPELVEDGVTGFLASAGDPSSLAEAIIRAIKAPDFTKELAKRAFQKAEAHFTAKKMVEENFKIYQNFNNHRRRR